MHTNVDLMRIFALNEDFFLITEILSFKLVDNMC